jgi:hypothetical protein
MFSIIQIKDGKPLSTLLPVARSVTGANEMLQREMEKHGGELINPLLSTEAKSKYEADLAKLADGKLFAVKNINEIKETKETKISSNETNIPETLRNDVAAPLAESWKKYKKTTETIPGWFGNETKTAKAELYSEFFIIEHDLNNINEFIENFDKSDDESREALEEIKLRYSTNLSSPTNCISWDGALVVGNLINTVMSEEDIQKLLSWASNDSAQSKNVRADLLNLIGYIYRHLGDEKKSREYFLTSANSGYPLAMVNLLWPNDIDSAEEEKWTKILNDLDYKYTFEKKVCKNKSLLKKKCSKRNKRISFPL